MSNYKFYKFIFKCILSICIFSFSVITIWRYYDNITLITIGSNLMTLTVVSWLRTSKMNASTHATTNNPISNTPIIENPINPIIENPNNQV